jgi:hypothetical protein
MRDWEPLSVREARGRIERWEAQREEEILRLQGEAEGWESKSRRLKVENDRLRATLARVEALMGKAMELDVPGGSPGWGRFVDVDDLREALGAEDAP